MASGAARFASEPSEPIETIDSHSSASTTASVHISRQPTQRDDNINLARHATALSRIETAKSQHNATVGQGLKSRTASRSSKPLPAFGAGKPYPPDLPDQEEYVVEFDGTDDPMHAMNWPFAKK